MKRLIGTRYVVADIGNRALAAKVLWGGFCVLIRGNGSFKLLTGPLVEITVPDQCYLEQLPKTVAPTSAPLKDQP